MSRFSLDNSVRRTYLPQQLLATLQRGSFHSSDPASRTFTACACAFSREAIRRDALRAVLYIIYYQRIRTSWLVYGEVRNY
jgi:hypothetical protein